MSSGPGVLSPVMGAKIIPKETVKDSIEAEKAFNDILSWQLSTIGNALEKAIKTPSTY